MCSMAKTDQPAPNDAQTAALDRFAVAHGRRWRSALIYAWQANRYGPAISADDCATLRQVRDQFGTAYLAFHRPNDLFKVRK